MFWESFSQEEWSDFEDSLQERLQEHLDASIGNMSFESFHTDFLDDIADELHDEWTEAGLIPSLELEDDTSIIASANYRNEIFELLEHYAYTFFPLEGVPLRYSSQQRIECPKKAGETAATLSNKIENLRAIKQPDQRTQEWYQFRSNLITASNLWKVFGTESEYNQLIFEKCQKDEGKRERSDSSIEYVNTSNPMHWGVKYEPLSIMIYEAKHAVTVGAFGCIAHPKHSFIGASPDGIVVEPTHSPLYGRMVEIKNIVNREITGSPSEAYWIQMQIQMETCDLDTCDFIETRFKEYGGDATVISPKEAFFAESDPTRMRGVVLYFLKSGGGGSPHYQFMPLSIPITEENVEQWIQETRKKLSNGLEGTTDKWVLYETNYWYLDEYSCVTVERNRRWAEWAIPHIRDVWDLILKERMEGYEHRAPKKRIAVVEDSNIQVVHSLESTTQYIRNFPTTQNICLIKLDENGNVCN
jgi:putative phage-type endonuclease